MAEINLPDVSTQWSSGGDILKPSDAKIQQGWQVEIPPRQWFNWLDNRQDEAIAHIAQHGIAVWSPTLEYQANKSYVQGSDGVIYKSTTINTGVNPVGDTTGTWQSAFLTADQAVQVATAAQSRARTLNNVYISPLQLGNAFNATGSAPLFAARAWGTFSGITSATLQNSGNIASVTRISSGLYQVIFSTNMTNAAYCVITNGSQTPTGQDTNQDTSSYFDKQLNGFKIETFGIETQRNDFFNVSFVVFGN